jgi:hypothetical protein
VKPHIKIRGVGGKHAYNGLYGAMNTIRKGNAFIFGMQYKVN